MTLMESLSVWPEVRPYIRIELYDRDGSARKPRHRIEVKAMPWELEERALELTAPCVACGAKIHPFRERRGPVKRQSLFAKPARNIYYAPTCPLYENIACSRGAQVRQEYLGVKRAVEA